MAQRLLGDDPELLENLWAEIDDPSAHHPMNRRDRAALSNRILKSFDDIVDQCCDAGNKLVDQPWRIMSIGLRDWLDRA